MQDVLRTGNELSPAPTLNKRAGERAPLAFHVVRIALGLLLLTAAYLKFRDLTWEPFGKAILVPPRVRVVFVEFEAALGLWLLAGFARRALWVTASAFFVALIGVNLYLIVQGEPTCGCFGQASFSPIWVMLGDAVAVAALVITRPRIRATADLSRGSGGRTVAVWASVGLAAVLIAQVVGYGGVAPAWEALTAQSVAVEPALSEIGSANAGDEVTFSATLRNLTSKPVQVIGGSNNCSCNATLDAPLTIPVGESRSVRIVGKFKGGPGRFVREYAFVTDQSAGGIVTARFAGTIPPGR